MKTKFFKYTLIILCLFIIYFILINSKLINSNIILAIELWITKVFPSLFPMFILNDILIYSGLPKIISMFFNRFFKIKGQIAYVFFMSIFSGTPSNAIILKSLLENGKIEAYDASISLSFTFFSNPIFLWNILKLSFNEQLCLKLILIHYLTNIIILMIFYNRIKNISSKKDKINTETNFSKILNNSIKNSINTLLMILGTITFYTIIGTIIIKCFDLSLTSQTIIKGFLEITQGLNNVSSLNISLKLKEIIAISIISFGGLSIHSQIQNIISDTKITYKYFLIGRILHVVLSILFVLFI